MRVTVTRHTISNKYGLNIVTDVAEIKKGTTEDLAFSLEESAEVLAEPLINNLNRF